VEEQSGTYVRYSVGCAGVWALILAAGARTLDPEEWDRLRLTCAGWWMGWTSATIARVVYPPPKSLAPEAEKRLATASLAADRARSYQCPAIARHQQTSSDTMTQS
jgi:hypothetical protein